MEKVPWTVGVGGTVKNIIFRKVRSGFVTIDSPFESRQAILKFVPSIKRVYLPDTHVLIVLRTSNRNPKRFQKPSRYIMWKGLK